MSANLLALGNCLPQLLKTNELPTFYKPRNVSDCCIASWMCEEKLLYRKFCWAASIATLVYKWLVFGFSSHGRPI